MNNTTSQHDHRTQATPPSRQRRMRSHRQHGAVYILVLMTATIVTVIGGGSLMLMRIQTRVTAARSDTIDARWAAHAAADLMLQRIASDPGWRTTYTHDTWTSSDNLHGATTTCKLVDTDDTDLADDPADDARLYVKATVGDTVRLYSVRLDAERAPNLLTNGDFEQGLTSWSGSDPTGNATLSLARTSVNNGAFSCYVGDRTNIFGGVRQDVTDRIAHGKTYYTKIAIDSPTATAMSVWIFLQFNTSTGTYYSSLSGTWSNTGWTNIAGTFTANWTGTLIEAQWVVVSTTSVDDFRVDDVVLSRGTTATTYFIRPVPGTWRQETQ